MLKVKEYLDKYYKPSPDNHTIDRGVFGNWIFPKNYINNNSIFNITDIPDRMIININNQTIMLGNIIVKGIKNKYNYLQTYLHLPRNNPDNNGYYGRSTESEIINYLEDYRKQIIKNNKLDRRLKINKILRII